MSSVAYNCHILQEDEVERDQKASPEDPRPCSCLPQRAGL